LAKNIVNDALHFALRIDKHKIPADLFRAYMQVELKALVAGNPSGHPSHRQKKEAREAARARLEVELEQGRHLQRKAYPVLWDCQAGELLVGTTSRSVVDRLLTLFEQTFGHGFEAQGAGIRAYQLAETRGQTRSVDDAEPTPFVAGQELPVVAWSPDEA